MQLNKYQAFLLSILMIVLANGLTTYSEKYINSSLASLVTTLSPLFVFGMNLLLEQKSFLIKTLLKFSKSFETCFFNLFKYCRKLRKSNYQQ
jgi:drug/metabolite transporter (DMT)-like permease